MVVVGETGDEGEVSVRWLETSLSGASESTSRDNWNSNKADICMVTATTTKGCVNLRPDRIQGSGDVWFGEGSFVLRR
ncbi:hypothetical protein PF003_g13219 [Phytophthora fragariae]|nr:hypothetical protein PF003_g13219 [Phytophthora fragariae]